MLLAAAVAALQVAVSPLAASRDGLVTIRVQGLAAPAASVVIHGGLASGGKMFGLVPLRDAGNGAWWTVLRAPGFYFHRDQRYNRLLRVRFTLPAAWPQYRLAAGTQTRWFSVARLSVEGGWKLLEVVPAP
jgi:hypothetical protein